MPVKAARGDRGRIPGREMMKLLARAALSSLALMGQAHAADLFGAAPPTSSPASDAPTQIEIGSNWYLRGDIGVSLDDGPTVSLSPIAVPPAGVFGQPLPAEAGPNARTTNLDGALGFGYRFSDTLRVDATWDYRAGPGANRSSTVVCPYGLYGASSQTIGYLQGYLYNPADACDGVMTVRQHTNTFLANAYVDLGTWNGLTPYVGGGLGVNVLSTSGGLKSYETANGQPYAADLTPLGAYPQIWVDSFGRPIAPQPAIAFAPQNRNRTLDSTTYGLAWALMAGFSYPLTPSVAIDIGFRYLNSGATRTLVNSQTGTTLKQTNVSEQVRVGVRYLIQ
jgi:opacity protein-like surface antigen